jgi:hypothetical protein
LDKATHLFAGGVSLLYLTLVLTIVLPFSSHGIRHSFPNPYYNPSCTSLNPNSQLPPKHPDFEPEERGVQKLLFSVRKNAASAAAAGPKRAGAKTDRRIVQAAGQGWCVAVSASRKTRSDEEADDMPTTPAKAKAELPTTPMKPKPKRAAA